MDNNSPTINALIVDDETRCTHTLETLLRELFPHVNIVGIAHNVPDAIQLYEKTKPNLVFLDVNMPPYTGFDFLNKVDSSQFKTIFCTAYDHYSIQAIRFSAFDYLLKPVQATDLLNTLGRLREEMMKKPLENQLNHLSQLIETPKESPSKMVISTTDEFLFVDISEISYLAADGNYTRFHLQNGEQHLSAKTLVYYEEILQGSQQPFIRTHRSYLVNVKQILKYNKNEDTITMKSGQSIAVASRKKESILEEIKKWM